MNGMLLLRLLVINAFIIQFMLFSSGKVIS